MKKEKILQQMEVYENEIVELAREFDLNEDIKTKQIIVDEMMITLNKMMKLNNKYNRRTLKPIKNVFRNLKKKMGLS